MSEGIGDEMVSNHIVFNRIGIATIIHNDLKRLLHFDPSRFLHSAPCTGYMMRTEVSWHKCKLTEFPLQRPDPEFQ
jgi:hypothetical protein